MKGTRGQYQASAIAYVFVLEVRQILAVEVEDKPSLLPVLTHTCRYIRWLKCMHTHAHTHTHTHAHTHTHTPPRFIRYPWQTLWLTPMCLQMVWSMFCSERQCSRLSYCLPPDFFSLRLLIARPADGFPAPTDDFSCRVHSWLSSGERRGKGGREGGGGGRGGRGRRGRKGRRERRRRRRGRGKKWYHGNKHTSCLV